MLTKTSRRKAPQKVSIEEYFRAEEKSVYKHEYHDGIVKKIKTRTFISGHLSTKITTLVTFF